MQKETQLVEKAKEAMMPAFRVTSIIDVDTFEVSQERKWNGETVAKIGPDDYYTQELYTGKSKGKGCIVKCLSMGSRLNSGSLTKWIGVVWSAKCLSKAETLPSFSPSI